MQMELPEDVVGQMATLSPCEFLRVSKKYHMAAAAILKNSGAKFVDGESRVKVEVAGVIFAFDPNTNTCRIQTDRCLVAFECRNRRWYAHRYVYRGEYLEYHAHEYLGLSLIHI
jgi:hypothetical protein